MPLSIKNLLVYHNTMRRLACLTSLMLFVALPAIAGDVPLPASKIEILRRTDQQLESETRRQGQLRTNLQKIDGELGGLRSTMIKVAREVKAREKEMSELEDKIADLQEERTTLQKKLQKDHKGIADLATALLRLRQIPPEALIARPGAPLETAQTAMILKDVITPLQTRALALRSDMAHLDNLEQDLKKRQQTLKDASKKLLVDQTELAELVRRRERAYDSVRNDLKSQEQDIQKLAQGAADFRELLKRLEDRNNQLANEQNKQAESSTIASLPATSLKDLGDTQMPISGLIRIGYGGKDELGSSSQGLRIEGRAGAIIVAPMNGIIRYQGFFKNYGNMLIIEHAKNYHSLVAGLAKIDTVVGQSVDAGEPLGTLGTTRTGRPSLYYELRQGGKPINPARIFADLG
jgi:murein hydrolase activator